MKPYYDNGVVQLYQADAREIPLPNQSVHCVVTSPPYFGLRVYQDNDARGIGLEASVEAYVANLVEVFREVRRVLRDDGVCWVNLGDSYSSGGRSDYGPTIGNKNIEIKNTPRAQVVLEDGNRLGIPERVVMALQADGWIWRDTVIWAKKSAMPESVNGWRWERCRVSVKPSEVKSGGMESGRTHATGRNMEDMAKLGMNAQWSDCPGCPKCEANDGLVLRRGSWRTTSSHEMIYMLTKKLGYFCDGEAVRQTAKSGIIETPQFVNQGNIFVQDLGFEKPAAEGPSTTPLVQADSNGGFLSVGIGLAATVLDGAEGQDNLGLALLDSQVGHQGVQNIGDTIPTNIPIMGRAATQATRFTDGDISAKEFLGKMHGLWVALADSNPLKESWGVTLRDWPFINPNEDTAVGIHDSSKVGQINCVHSEQYTIVGTPSRGTRNRRSVWNDISPEPYGGSHFATFPSDLPRICIQASTSERGVCPECGSQWARVVEHKNMKIKTSERAATLRERDGVMQTAAGGSMDSPAETNTLGWRATCDCQDEVMEGESRVLTVRPYSPIPATVLDPFAGTATTCLAAQKLGRRTVGLDISESYLKQAVKRLTGVTLPMLEVQP